MFTYSEPLPGTTVLRVQPWPSKVNSSGHTLSPFIGCFDQLSGKETRWASKVLVFTPSRCGFTREFTGTMNLSEIKQLFCANIAFNHQESIALGSALHDSWKSFAEISHQLTLNTMAPV